MPVLLLELRWGVHGQRGGEERGASFLISPWPGAFQTPGAVIEYGLQSLGLEFSHLGVITGGSEELLSVTSESLVGPSSGISRNRGM